MGDPSKWLRAVARLSGAAFVSCSLAGCLPRERKIDGDASSARASTGEPETASPKGGEAPEGEAKPRAAERKASTLLAKAQRDALLTAPFQDDFSGENVGPNWRLTGAGWRVANGQLCATGARNHPAWLARKLPTNAAIEFEATSASPDGDIKAEAWGDGARFAAGTSYGDATSYLVIFGGWKNRHHVLARLDEHGDDRKVEDVSENGESLKTRRVEPGRTYRFKVERRDGKTVTWSVDGEVIHEFEDDEPLAGEGHDHFGFNDWDARVCFDNLSIKPL